MFRIFATDEQHAIAAAEKLENKIDQWLKTERRLYPDTIITHMQISTSAALAIGSDETLYHNITATALVEYTNDRG